MTRVRASGCATGELGNCLAKNEVDARGASSHERRTIRTSPLSSLVISPIMVARCGYTISAKCTALHYLVDDRSTLDFHAKVLSPAEKERAGRADYRVRESNRFIVAAEGKFHSFSTVGRLVLQRV